MKASGATAPAAPASTSAEAALDALDALDARARAVYETVRDAVTAHGYPPSMRALRPPSAPRILAASILRTPMTFLRCPCCPA